MTLTEGMDTERVRRAAAAIERQATAVLGAERDATRAVSTLRRAWEGPDAETFARRWQRSRQDLLDLSSALGDQARALQSQVSDQERVSAVAGVVAHVGAGAAVAAAAGAGANSNPVVDIYGAALAIGKLGKDAYDAKKLTSTLNAAYELRRRHGLTGVRHDRAIARDMHGLYGGVWSDEKFRKLGMRDGSALRNPRTGSTVTGMSDELLDLAKAANAGALARHLPTTAARLTPVLRLFNRVAPPVDVLSGVKNTYDGATAGEPLDVVSGVAQTTFGVAGTVMAFSALGGPVAPAIFAAAGLTMVAIEVWQRREEIGEALSKGWEGAKTLYDHRGQVADAARQQVTEAVDNIKDVGRGVGSVIKSLNPFGG